MKVTFKEWLEKDDCIYKHFIMLRDRLEMYLKEYVTHNGKLEVCDRFDDVLRNCDTITYNENGVSCAYAILHFLDRYHRFQLIFLELIEKKKLPIKESIDIIDIGSGPGPSMYATSDMYNLYRLYEEEIYGKSKIKKINIEYVESLMNLLIFYIISLKVLIIYVIIRMDGFMMFHTTIRYLKILKI